MCHCLGWEVLEPVGFWRRTDIYLNATKSGFIKTNRLPEICHIRTMARAGRAEKQYPLVTIYWNYVELSSIHYEFFSKSSWGLHRHRMSSSPWENFALQDYPCTDPLTISKITRNLKNNFRRKPFRTKPP